MNIDKGLRVSRRIRNLFSKENRKYYYSEIAAYIGALVATSAAAAAASQWTDSDLLITLISAMGATLAFLAAAIGIFGLLHVPQYRRRQRRFRNDCGIILRSYLQGFLATYAVRIPLQYVLQKMEMDPALAAPIAQTIAGQVGNIVRIHSNYRNNIFGSSASADTHKEEKVTS